MPRQLLDRFSPWEACANSSRMEGSTRKDECAFLPRRRSFQFFAFASLLIARSYHSGGIVRICDMESRRLYVRVFLFCCRDNTLRSSIFLDPLQSAMEER